MKKSLIPLFIVVTLIISNLSAIGQNLIKNASFELNPSFFNASTSWREFIEYNTTGFASAPPAGYTFSSIAQWVITSNQVDLHNAAHKGMGCPPPPGGGTHHIDVNDKGTIRQKGITLLPDRSYVLSFFTSAHALLTCPDGASAKVEIIDSASSTVFFTTNVNVTSADISKWTFNRVVFAAGKTSKPVFLDLKAVKSCLTSGWGGVLFDSIVLKDTLIQQETNIQDKQTELNILSQNSPNPFSLKTTIHYELTRKFNSASIQIIDISGRVIKNIELTNNSGDVNIDGNTIKPGYYTYILNIDGSNVDVKRMHYLAE